ncbi:TPA: AMP-binding protein [Pseudomonas aeruginosa]|nr:AMP-binding protein [Pseudomonas aeruginosa]HEP9306360.1 AMP-binding protein [Pseudomonas aeruginosa]
MDASPLARIARHQAQETPSRLALSFENRHITYQELNRRADQVARGLWTAGAYGGRRVATVLGCCPELYEVGVAAARAGAVLVPLAQSLSAERILEVLKDCRPRAIFVSPQSMQRLEPIRLQLYFVELIVVTGQHFSDWRSHQVDCPGEVSPWVGDVMLQSYSWDACGSPCPVRLKRADLRSDFPQLVANGAPVLGEDDSLVDIPSQTEPVHGLLTGLAALVCGVHVRLHD